LSRYQEGCTLNGRGAVARIAAVSRVEMLATGRISTAAGSRTGAVAASTSRPPTPIGFALGWPRGGDCIRPSDRPAIDSAISPRSSEPW